jgi:uncharacterized membrane protein
MKGLLLGLGWLFLITAGCSSVLLLVMVSQKAPLQERQMQEIVVALWWIAGMIAFRTLHERRER